jgi:2-polyprenyl-3-methyl-5-hydroxy-6-metoxy-1,4-benzoquinol methylase
MKTLPYIEKFYQNQGNLALLNLIPPDNSGRALDCGCGAGDNARLLKERHWSVTGITLSQPEQTIALQYCEQVYLADLEQGLPQAAKTKYELVIMSHILEHLVNPAKLLQAVKEVLLPNGLVAVALPNVLAYPQRLKFLRGKFEYEKSGVMDETHVRFYTFATGAKLLQAQGYEIITARGDGAFPLWKLRQLLPTSVVQNLNTWSCQQWPGLFGSQSLYLAKVKV